jgi:hypothetical protein
VREKLYVLTGGAAQSSEVKVAYATLYPETIVPQNPLYSDVEGLRQLALSMFAE